MPQIPSRAPRMLHPGWRLALFVLMLALCAGVIAVLFVILRVPPQRSHGVLQPVPMLGTGVAVVVAVLAATLACLRFLEHRRLATVGLPVGPVPYTGLIGGVLVGAVVPLTACGILRLSGHALIEGLPLSGDQLVRATLPMAGATILLSSWEEIAFRGYPLQLLSEIGGPWLAAAMTGLLFGLAHSGNPGANPLGLVNTALNGALLGMIVIRTGSLWLACGYHAGWNLAASTLLGMRDSGTIASGSIFSTTLSGPRWLSGGEYGFEASVLTGVIETLVLVAILANASRLPAVLEAQPYFSGRHDRSPAFAAG